MTGRGVKPILSTSMKTAFGKIRALCRRALLAFAASSYLLGPLFGQDSSSWSEDLYTPPGCLPRSGFKAPGGCRGKSSIVSIVVKPRINCLSIRANNCNGGVIEITNDCSEDLWIGKLRFSPRAARPAGSPQAPEPVHIAPAAEGTMKIVPCVQSGALACLNERVTMLRGLLGGRGLSVMIEGDKAWFNPEIDCVSLQDSRKGRFEGPLLVKNNCSQDLSLEEIAVGDMQAQPLQRTFELFRNEDSSVDARFVGGNFSKYFPDKTEILKIAGRIGKGALELSYRKTKKLCP